jgi:undecaprenyl diphosphate synthase
MHVGIILDGNRRYARAHNMPLYKGHEKGAETISKLFKWAKELGIDELTLYSFSMQNFSRKKEEVSYLFKLFEKFFSKFLKLLKEGKNKLVKLIRLNFIGRLRLFPKRIQRLIKLLIDKTKDNKELKVNFAFGYGGREEIVDAVNKIIKKGAKKVDEKIISENLYLSSEPDIIVRTGGEQRTSNFLPWQGIYAEWFFLKKTWPEFNKLDLKKVLSQFNSRERRFGV